jgi:hypothetical protein
MPNTTSRANKGKENQNPQMMPRESQNFKPKELAKKDCQVKREVTVIAKN